MTKQGSVRHRSPAYPAVGLRNAVERLRNLYAKDGKAGAPAELAAVHIGFGKAHGQALAVLSALKKFGLITEVGGRFAPSQRGLEILNLPAGDPRRQKALQEAILEPSVYRELIEQHRETGWPADDVLASELVTYKEFNPKAVKGFVEDLRDSLEFSGLSGGTALESEEEGNSDVPETKIDNRSESAVRGNINTSDLPGKGKTPTVRSYTFALSPETKADLVFHGDVTEEALRALRDYVDITIRVLGGLKKAGSEA